LSKTDLFSSIKQIIFEFNDDLPTGSNDYSPATAPEYTGCGRLLAMLFWATRFAGSEESHWFWAFWLKTSGDPSLRSGWH